MQKTFRRGAVLALGLLLIGPAAVARAADKADGPAWPSPVEHFVPPQPGEHPRLLFRKGDLPQLRERAKTPEGQALIKRLRAQLNGSDGESMPTVFNGSGHAYQGNKAGGEDEANKDNGKDNGNNNVGKSDAMPLGAYTMSHAAGYGLLYQLTGDKKYADLGRQCFDKALAGVRDRDDRYSFRQPGGALRAGPSIGWYALGYDLCYDGWDADYRQKVAKALAEYNEGKWMSLPELAKGLRQHPGSNHWGMEVGGAAMALLAVADDPGVDMKQLDPLLDASAKCMVRNMTEGFGDGGFFAEGDGTGSMSSHIAFLPALLAWRTAAGKDFISPRPNARWMAMKWFFLTAGRDGASPHDAFWPQRGAYPHNIWTRDDKSGAGYFSIGLGVGTDDQKAAVLWCYDHWGLKAADDKAGTPLDTPSPYPHLSVLSFVNWPLGMAEKDPDDVLPHAYRDSKWGFYAWRNRWQDGDDTVVSVLTQPTKGNYACKAENTLSIASGGKHRTWGRISGGFTGDYQPAADGSTVLTCGDGSCLAVDFSKASGADVLLVIAGPSAAASGGDVVEAGGTKFAVLALGGGELPRPQALGDKVAVGGQTVSFDGKRITLGK